MEATGTVAALSVYPVKGLSAQRLDSVTLHEGEGVRGDRAWALARAGGEYRPGTRRAVPKGEFHVLVRDERLAGLQTRLVDDSVLTVAVGGHPVLDADLDTGTGRMLAQDFFARVLDLITLRDLVDEVAEGDEVELGLPVDSFPLEESASYLLIAGGIGITAIRSFYRHLRATGHRSVRLLYLVRSVEDAAYADELLDDPAVTVHESSVEGRLDLWPYLAAPDDSTRVYCCAGPALSEEVRRLTMHWRPSRIHFESFDGVEAVGGLATPFDAVWAPTGIRVPVSATTTLLRALRDEGITVPSSCESGTCGTCVLRLEAGIADHRDLVLTAVERETRIISCVSRAAEGDLVVGPV